MKSSLSEDAFEDADELDIDLSVPYVSFNSNNFSIIFIGLNGLCDTDGRKSAKEN